MPSESSWAVGHTGRPIARDGASAEAAPPSTKKPTELGFGQFSSHHLRLALTGRGYLGFAAFRLFPACDGPPAPFGVAALSGRGKPGVHGASRQPRIGPCGLLAL